VQDCQLAVLRHALLGCKHGAILLRQAAVLTQLGTAGLQPEAPALKAVTTLHMQLVVECCRWEVLATEAARGLAAVPGCQDIQSSGWLRSKRLPAEAFDHYLHVQRGDSLQCWGFGLQTRVPKVRQHYNLPQKERTIFVAQQGVPHHRQLAILYSTYTNMRRGAAPG
jgi:hypothetical protein